MMITKYLLHLLMCFLLLVVPTSTTTYNPTGRSINIKNRSGHKVELYWIHPQTKVGQLQSDPNIINGADYGINSYIGHHFELRGLKKGGKCGHGMRGKGCHKAYFTVNDNSDQGKCSIIYYYDAALSLFHIILFRLIFTIFELVCLMYSHGFDYIDIL